MTRTRLPALALCVLATSALLASLSAPGASADVLPADLSASTLTCSDVNGGAFRPGDDVNCVLRARNAPNGENAVNVSATVTIPANATFNPLDPANGGVTSSTPTTISFDATKLGLIFHGGSQQVGFTLTLSPSAQPGDTLAVDAVLSGTSDPSGTPLVQSVSSNPLTVDPPPADLTGSTMACHDTTPATALLPGDDVACTLLISDAPAREDATNVTASLTLPTYLTYVSGGTGHSGQTISWSTSDTGASGSPPGTIPTGASSGPLAFEATLSADTLGGTVVAPAATVFYTNAISGTVQGLSVVAPSLATAPGRARLVGSLICSDTNGGVLRPGDDITCVVSVTPQFGYESVQGVSAVASIPSGTSWASGGSSHSASAVTLDASQLGDVTAGTTKSASFHLTVNPDTVVGTTIASAGPLTGTSVPLGGPVSKSLTANTLLVGQDPTVDTSSPAADLSVSAVVDKPALPIALAAKGSKPLHVTLKLHNAGPSIAQSPSFSLIKPDGVQFESIDPSAAVSCAQATLTRITCTLTADALGADSDVTAGIGLSVSMIPSDPGKRVIQLDAGSATPDPTLNATSLTIPLTLPATASTKPRTKTISLRVAPGKRVSANVAKRGVVGTLPGGTVKVMLAKNAGKARSGTASVKGTTLTYKAKPTGKGTDTLRYTLTVGSIRLTGTVKVTIAKAKKK